MDQQTQMKLLLEAVDAPKVDEPSKSYANSPDEQTLDSATQQNFGNDLNKKKPKQFKYKPGDNARSARLQEYELEESRLTKAYKKFKLNEGIDDKWTTKRECAAKLDDAIKETGVLNSIISPENFNDALDFLMNQDYSSAVDLLMDEYTDHNGGMPRDWYAIAEELANHLEEIADLKGDVALETAGDSSGESATLKKLHHAEVDQLDGVSAKVFGPTEAYPAPWTARHVGGRYPIYAIKAANKAEVATWLNKTQAETVIAEIS